jgi:ribosomal protein S27AE
MGKKLRDMTEPELAAAMRGAADAALSRLPRGTLFVLLAFDSGPGVAQYICNAEREGIIRTLRETADRLERREEVDRVPFEGPSYTCPRCGSVSRNTEDIRLRYCGHCHRFDGPDEV